MSMLTFFLRASLLSWIVFAPVAVIAAVDNATVENAPNEKVSPSTEIPGMQKRLDNIKGQVSGETNDRKLSELNEQVTELTASITALSQALIPQRAQLEAQLAVLGPAPTPEGGVKETNEVTRKRNLLENQKNKLNAQIKQAEEIKNGTLILSTQIINLRRDTLKTQLTLNSGSILGLRFWAPLMSDQNSDKQKISHFAQQLAASAASAWQGRWRAGTLGWLLAAVITATFGRRYSEELFAWISVQKMPEGRLRRSFLAITVALSTLLAVLLAFNFVALAFTRHADVSDNIRDFGNKLLVSGLFCGLIAGLGRAFLSTRRASWRLSALSNSTAMALKSFPPLTASLVFVFQTVEAINYSAGTSVASTILANGLTGLLIGTTVLSVCFFASRARRKSSEQQDRSGSTLAGLILIALMITGIGIIASLVTGYVNFGRFVSDELIWIGIVSGCWYLLSHLTTDICENLFSVNNPAGSRLKHSLNIDERHLLQAASLLSAAGKTGLMIFAVMLMVYGTLSTSSPMELLQKAWEFWGGRGLESLNIVPAHIFTALFCLVIGIWALRRVTRWLDSDFLPKTTMDAGMRMSLMTLFSNVGYVLIILLTLSIMGLQWNKLAWIVSALSVGIGFGLQEIVKNFISGLILLTERPIKVGDLVSISGIEGDIRRINVRATEIQLGDKSTVIVPNSQLIAQNVRNATMGNAQGVTTITLTFPLDIDPVQVRQLLLDVYNANERILETPEPTVTFSDLTPTGIVLSVTGNVSSPRQVSEAKSDLLFDILTLLRKEGVTLSMPQTMVIEQKNPDGSAVTGQSSG